MRQSKWNSDIFISGGKSTCQNIANNCKVRTYFHYHCTMLPRFFRDSSRIRMKKKYIWKMCIQNMKVLLDKQKSMVSGCAMCIEKMPGKHSAQTGKMTSFKVWSMVIRQFRFLKSFNFFLDVHIFSWKDF